MQWSDIQWNPSEKTLRQFAGLLLVIFGLLALVEVQFRHRPQLAAIYAAIAVTFGPLVPVERVRRPTDAQVSELTLRMRDAITALLPPAYHPPYTGIEGDGPERDGGDSPS